MKIVICTTPIRPVPTDTPPFGSLAVIQALQLAGYDSVFFDIDGLRPSFPEAVARFKAEAPDIIGISAVVSTAYSYVKQLCCALKEAVPNAKIVLGGNLAASAELLHRFCHVDVAVVGEGEKPMVNLVRYYERHPSKDDYDELAKIKGISFLAPSGEMTFTGYEAAIPPHELLDPDFSILERFSNIDNFIIDSSSRGDFIQDPRGHESHRAGKRVATVHASKGCVARCTFCHRWEKGFRQVPPHKVIARIRYLMDRYNVGFIVFGDENFGSDLKATDELIRLIKPLDILWMVGGIRAHTIELERLKRMRDAGCVALYYGFESGSPEILEVMEKKLDLEDNLHAARCTHEAGLYTIYQLVLGMPGETHRTISDTAEMLKQITEFLPEPPYQRLSINYIQALPGTPVYEYARAIGLIGSTLEEEERYLLTISDVDAGDDTKFLNFTRYPYLTVQTWRPRLLYESAVHWYKTRRKQHLSFNESRADAGFKAYRSGGYFNLHDVGRNPSLLIALYPFRWLFIWMWTLITVARRTPPRIFLVHVWELLTWRLRRHRPPFTDYRSMRHVMRDLALKPTTQTQESMMPLRLGR